jgi:hypothetical protein
MKPIEWFFLFVLYTFEERPENRIAVQYLSGKDRLQIAGKLQQGKCKKDDIIQIL